MPLLNTNTDQDDTSDFALRWYKVRNRVKEEFGQRPDLNAILFIIGINEVGIVKDSWEKEEKLNLMHVAVCKLLSSEGYYVHIGDDSEGWPVYEAIKGLPTLSMKEQESLLKRKVVEYFEAL
jgi:hypothetical protein